MVTAFSQAAAVVFFLGQGLLLFHLPNVTNLGVDFNELPNELFEAAEFRDLERGFFQGSGSWQRLGNGLAPLFEGQTRIWPMNRLAGLVAAAVGLTATAAGIGDRATAEIAKDVTTV